MGRFITQPILHLKLHFCTYICRSCFHSAILRSTFTKIGMAEEVRNSRLCSAPPSSILFSLISHIYSLYQWPSEEYSVQRRKEGRRPRKKEERGNCPEEKRRRIVGRRRRLISHLVTSPARSLQLCIAHRAPEPELCSVGNRSDLTF